jgi:hypothetical protein
MLLILAASFHAVESMQLVLVPTSSGGLNENFD